MSELLKAWLRDEVGYVCQAPTLEEVRPGLERRVGVSQARLVMRALVVFPTRKARVPPKDACRRP
jgi:hypothetical protein